MREEEGIQASPKRYRGRQTSKQDGTQINALQRPAKDDKEAWKGYWEQQDQPWRTGPEIDTERQKYLVGCRNIIPSIEQGIYPFKGIKLSRADVEWLLATHDEGHGPIDWSDETQRKRKGLDLRGADLQHVNLKGLLLASMCGGLTLLEWIDATEEQRKMAAVLMRGAILSAAHLEGAILTAVHLEEAILTAAHLEGAILTAAVLDRATRLDGIVLSSKQYGEASLADVDWGHVDVLVVDWSAISILGDERTAKQQKDESGETKGREDRLDEFQTAVRAYRQLALLLRDHGLTEEAARFLYRSQLLKQKVLWLQRKFGQYLFSLFLDLFAGYGYRPIRCFIVYLIVNTAFATAYYLIGHAVGQSLSPIGAFVFSITSFHGRGFFPAGNIYDDPLTIIASIQAVLGLLIEVIFIATFSQRILGK
jgi:hypothetical protein